MARPKQLEFACTGWGGKRTGAGRKREGPRRRVAHGRREMLASRTPVHVTLRLAPKLPNLRIRSNHRVVLAALLAGSKPGFRVIHYVALTNHMHLICEAADEIALARGMQGLCIRLARRLNRVWKRRGGVFDDHYHVHHLKTPTEVHHAVRYVLENAKRHGIRVEGDLDPFSSASWFGAKTGPFPAPRTWLLRQARPVAR